jgi:hypothetical protein
VGVAGAGGVSWLMRFGPRCASGLGDECAPFRALKCGLAHQARCMWEEFDSCWSFGLVLG